MRAEHASKSICQSRLAFVVARVGPNNVREAAFTCRENDVEINILLFSTLNIYSDRPKDFSGSTNSHIVGDGCCPFHSVDSSTPRRNRSIVRVDGKSRRGEEIIGDLSISVVQH